MLDTANPSDLRLIQIMTGLRRCYESLNRRYEEELVHDFRVNAPVQKGTVLDPRRRYARFS